MVLQREKHTVIKPFTTNYDETHPRMVDSLYSLHFITGFLPWFSTCFPHVFHMFSMCFTPFLPSVPPRAPRSWPRPRPGAPFPCRQTHRRRTRSNPAKIAGERMKKCGKNVVKKCGEKMWNGVTTWVSGCCDCKPSKRGEDGKGDSTCLQNGGFVISVMPKMAKKIRQDLELKSKQHRHLVGICPNN